MLSKSSARLNRECRRAWIHFVREKIEGLVASTSDLKPQRSGNSQGGSKMLLSYVQHNTYGGKMPLTLGVGQARRVGVAFLFSAEPRPKRPNSPNGDLNKNSHADNSRSYMFPAEM
jgi:hypothetical protein